MHSCWNWRRGWGKKGQTDERVLIFIPSESQYQRTEYIKPLTWKSLKHPTSCGRPQWSKSENIIQSTVELEASERHWDSSSKLSEYTKGAAGLWWQKRVTSHRPRQLLWDFPKRWTPDGWGSVEGGWWISTIWSNMWSVWELLWGTASTDENSTLNHPKEISPAPKMWKRQGYSHTIHTQESPWQGWVGARIPYSAKWFC